ncbi:PIN domain-containing protein [Burkholderia cenocepacia]|uniref:type II toxin-antitoxin system VapC family toxin n=1 Tax=Burkholderia cepacia complex TaxID=87882 RepID=UPI00196A92D7|nr:MULTISPECIES: PIN domain-containing protein [Burkholderia cepacia complex]MBN3534104.1 PIN domain-containing protein [Burkholderia cenocepacia]MBO1859089.1 PIN domain-containing protein [Burkholderia cenocepacia]MBR7906435.1 PIN domain-containing protein [Burkholderia cenocepacia]MBR8029836.1 PIN domain-containing protein [Burkholderia cenocepacia]MBR8172590.1 PIN domain-containing protein [Burkholderia cenocepacia]
MSVLVDTSVWVEHFRRPLPALIQLLRVDNVLTHPLVILELTCGTPPEPRARTLGDLALLRQTRLATPGEVADWIERERLYGRGCGAVDCTLLASVLLTSSTRLWTRDRRLAQLAEKFGVHYVPPDLH